MYYYITITITNYYYYYYNYNKKKQPLVSEITHTTLIIFLLNCLMHLLGSKKVFRCSFLLWIVWIETGKYSQMFVSY